MTARNGTMDPSIEVRVGMALNLKPYQEREELRKSVMRIGSKEFHISSFNFLLVLVDMCKEGTINSCKGNRIPGKGKQLEMLFYPIY